MNVSSERKMKFRTGNQMIAEGAVASGCRFFAGYPITPASGIYKSMIELLQQRGDVAVSAPDEISALAYCVGASMRGYKAMTATSGPGWALMIETVQYALMTETPLVIAMVQRLGPCTGGATQGAQGDILLTEYCTSGGYTIPVLCASTAAECFELTQIAFSWAEQLRTPVVILSDKEVGMTSESVDYNKLHTHSLFNRVYASPQQNGKKWKTYNFENRWDVPAFADVGGVQKVTITGSAHNKEGALKKNDTETLEVLLHLEEKIQHGRDELSIVKYDEQKDAAILVISFGITARTMSEAVRSARKKGKKVSSMNIISLFPVPEKAIMNAIKNVTKVIIAEENLTGQYRSVIAPLLKGKEIIGVNKVGAMITPNEIEVHCV
ncbi:MAG: pyruvate flavodoxin/ferredoxin oxidoreductase [Bacteroidota bacterium]